MLTEKAWWKDKLDLVQETDRALAVVSPRADASPDVLRKLGAALEGWRVSRPYARHIWGLDDLLEGRSPRTPPIYLSVPILLDRFHESYEPVALVFVALEADSEKAAADLCEHLADLRQHLAWLEDPDAYAYYQR